MAGPKKSLSFIFAVLFLLILIGSPLNLLAQQAAPAPQAPTEPSSTPTPEIKPIEHNRSFFVYPVGASLIGVGPIYGLAAGVNKLTGNDINIMLAKTYGNIDAFGLTVTGIPVIPQSLFIDVGFAKMEKGLFETDYTRGLNESDVYLQEIEAYGLKFELKYLPTTWLVLRPGFAQAEAKIKGYKYEDKTVEIGKLGDINTDYLFMETDFVFLDQTFRPNSGIKSTLGAMAETGRKGQSDQITLSYSVTGFLPIMNSLNLASTFFSSDATVIKRVFSKRSDVADELDAGCADASGADDRERCEELESDLIDYIAASNQYGSAHSIGGSRYLRSFREGRFRGAHTRAFSTELRWTVSDAFGLTYFQDNGSALDFVPFYDYGWANDDHNKVFEEYKSSYGAAVRLYMNPLVLRLEYATGDEGGGLFLTAGAAW
jgi:hypothetical protein